MSNEVWQLDMHTVNAYCYYSNVFDNEMLDGILKIGNDLSQVDALTGGGPNQSASKNEDIRKTTLAWINPTEENAWLFRKLTDVVVEANNKWFNFDLRSIETLQFSTYNEGDFYAAHTDHFFQGPGQNPRKLSFSMQLTDPSEYDGGDTLLITDGKGFAIPKERGTIAFFPSYTLHEVKPITRGTRKALVGWVHGPKFK